MNRRVRLALCVSGCVVAMSAGAGVVSPVEDVSAPSGKPTPLPIKPYVAPKRAAEAPPAPAAAPSSAAAMKLTAAPANSEGAGTVAERSLPTSAPPLPRWEVRTSDVTLARTLDRWAAAASHRMRWDAPRNFHIAAPTVYAGTFESALAQLLSSAGIRDSDFPLEACIYANEPPLVRITALGAQTQCDPWRARP